MWAPACSGYCSPGDVYKRQAYTQGRGRLICTLAGYDVCHNPEEVIASIGYDCDRDLENPCDSVFLSLIHIFWVLMAAR